MSSTERSVRGAVGAAGSQRRARAAPLVFTVVQDSSVDEGHVCSAALSLPVCFSVSPLRAALRCWLVYAWDSRAVRSCQSPVPAVPLLPSASVPRLPWLGERLGA